MMIKHRKEKKLIVARKLAERKNDGKSFTPQDIYDIWNQLFPDDFKLPDGIRLIVEEYEKEGEVCHRLVKPDDVKRSIPKGTIKKYSNQFIYICQWIMKQVYHRQNIRRIDKQIRELRREEYETLLKIFKKIHCYLGMKDIEPGSPELTTYYVYAGYDKVYGNYEEIWRYGIELRKAWKKVRSEMGEVKGVKKDTGQ